jgi:hypothetical protein
MGTYWALVTVSSTGYGDRVPKTKLGRFFSLIWITMGMMLVALVQSTVLKGLVSGSDTYISQLQRTVDNLGGLRVAVVDASVQEWHIRSRGSHVVALGDEFELLSVLKKNEVDAVAMDALAAAMMTSDQENIRPSGMIPDSAVVYGVLLSEAAAQSLAYDPITHRNTTLDMCMETIVGVGLDDLRFGSYYANYSGMAYPRNMDLADREAQESALYRAKIDSAIAMPIAAAAALLIAFLVDRFVFRKARETKYAVMPDDLAQPQPPEQPHNLPGKEEPLGGERTDGTVSKKRAAAAAAAAVPPRAMSMHSIGPEDVYEALQQHQVQKPETQHKYGHKIRGEKKRSHQVTLIILFSSPLFLFICPSSFFFFLPAGADGDGTTPLCATQEAAGL